MSRNITFILLKNTDEKFAQSGYKKVFGTTEQ
jgi:hypothetical protein